MSQPGSVTGYLDRLKAGDDAAAQGLWEEYFARLIGLARARVAGRPTGPDASQDLALSAFDSFCQAAAAGRFPRLADRHDLWQILMMLTARKAIDAVRRERALKRLGALARADRLCLEGVIGREPSPEFAAEVADQCRALLELLGDELRQLALWKMEGRTNREIAGLLGKSLATIERKLDLIRRKWEVAL